MGTVMPEKDSSMINSINSRFFCLIALAITVALGPGSWHKCRPTCLAVIPSAKPVTVEHIKVHGTVARRQSGR